MDQAEPASVSALRYAAALSAVISARKKRSNVNGKDFSMNANLASLGLLFAEEILDDAQVKASAAHKVR